MRYINYYDNDTLIGINYKLKTIGYFNTEKEAKEARKYYCENQ